MSLDYEMVGTWILDDPFNAKKDRMALIYPDKISKTIEYIKCYSVQSDKDVAERWDWICEESTEKFGSGCGSICSYKLLIHLLQYISTFPLVLNLDYHAPVICFILMNGHNELYNTSNPVNELTFKEFCDVIEQYHQKWNEGCVVADGEYMWRSDGDYNSLLQRLQKACEESKNTYQFNNVLHVMVALQWDDERISKIQQYLEDDEI